MEEKSQKSNKQQTSAIQKYGKILELILATNKAPLGPVAFWIAMRISSSVTSSQGSISCKITIDVYTKVKNYVRP